MFNCVKEGSNRPHLEYFLLIQHLLIFSGTLLKKRKDEQYLAERSSKKARKVAKKHCTKVPRNWTHVARPAHSNRHKWPGQSSGTVQPCQVAHPCHLPVLGDVRQNFGTVTPCLGARPYHPSSASQLKFAFGVILRETQLFSVFHSSTFSQAISYLVLEFDCYVLDCILELTVDSTFDWFD